MDTPAGLCIFFLHSDFINYLQLCQSFNLDVTDFLYHSFDGLLFFNELDFIIFLGLITNHVNQNHVVWAFLE